MYSIRYIDKGMYRNVIFPKELGAHIGKHGRIGKLKKMSEVIWAIYKKM